MPFPGARRSIVFEDGPKILFGTKVTRATVALEYPHVPIGTIYLTSVATGSTGRAYLKVTHTGSGIETDWQKVTTSAAD